MLPSDPMAFKIPQSLVASSLGSDSTSLPQEQASKTDMLSVVSIQVLCTVEEGVANACI